MTPNIRPFSTADLRNCSQLFVDVFNAPPWTETWSEEDAGQRISDLSITPHFLGLVAETDGNLVALALGYSQRYQNEWHYQLVEFCVREELQGKGVGRALMENLHNRLQASGIHRCYTLTARGTPAQEFYEKGGFYLSPKMILMARRY